MPMAWSEGKSCRMSAGSFISGKLGEIRLHERVDEHRLGGSAIESARHEIEHLLGVDASDGRGVRAADVLVPDLEHRYGVDLGGIRKQERLLLLAADAAVGALLDADEAPDDGLGAAGQDRSHAKFGGRARGGMDDLM